MNSDYPYLEFIKIVKDCRNVMVEDTLQTNSPDLYDALYSNVNSKIHEIKLELYELKWLEMHWDKISEFVGSKNYSNDEKKEFVALFTKWYEEYINKWKLSEFDALIFEERISILKMLISVNDEWEQNMKRIKVSFKQSKKILNEKIKILEESDYEGKDMR